MDKSNGQTQLDEQTSQPAPGNGDDHAACDFDELKLDEASEEAIEQLEEDEKVVVLMPAMEFVVAHGPRRTVLYTLCRNAEITEKINDFLEGKVGRVTIVTKFV